EGIRHNGFTRDAVLDYLKTLDSPEKAHSGVVGETFFDENGDSKRPVQMAQVKDGQFVAAEMQLSPEGKPVPASGVSGAEEDAAATPEAAESPQAAQVTPAAEESAEPLPEATP